MKQINKPIQFNLKTPESWFMEILNQMEQKIKLEYPNSIFIFFHINGELYMKYDKIYHVLWFSPNKIYKVLKSKFNLNQVQINKIVKNVMEEQTNLKINTIVIRYHLVIKHLNYYETN